MSEFIVQNDWPKTDLAKHYLLFATRVRELVHPQAQDIYRVHALSTLDKVRELRKCSEEVISGKYDKKALKHILREVKEAINADPVCKKITDKRNLTSAALDCDKENPEDLISYSQLWLSIIEDTYQDELEKLIIEKISSIKEKSLLLVLSKIYVSLLIGKGFHRKYILESSESVFFRKKIGKCTPNLVKRFFDKFSEKKSVYEIFYLGEKNSIERLATLLQRPATYSVEELSKTFKMKIPDSVHIEEDLSAARLREMEGRDPYEVCRRVEIILNLPDAFNVTYPLSQPLRSPKDLLVKDKKTEEVFHIRRIELVAPVHSFTSLIDYSDEMFGRFLEFNWAPAERGQKSFAQLYFSLSAASSALHIESPQTQLVSIWSAFEALLPPPSKFEPAARITHFCDLITPTIARKYIKGKYRIFLDDVARHSSFDLPSILGKELSRGEQTRRLYSILREDGSECDKVFSGLSDSPVALNRINSLFELARNPKLVQTKLLAHEERVKWQIHRIYRERNSIVHSGIPSKALPVLVENSFLYYRLVIRALQLAWEKYEIFDPHAALILISNQYEESKNRLKNAINQDNKDIRAEVAQEVVFVD